MNDYQVKSNSWFQRLLCCCCTSKNKNEPASGRYDVHKRRRQQATIDRICRTKHENHPKIDPIRVCHVKFYDEAETGSININKNFFD